jgi:hypothetical protein
LRLSVAVVLVLLMHKLVAVAVVVLMPNQLQ